MAPTPMPPLPWAELNARDGADVARVLGLTATVRGGRALEGGRKFPCVWCESSDALHAYQQGGVHCFSCGSHASNVDLAACVLGLPPAEALRSLADRLGVYVPERGVLAVFTGHVRDVSGRCTARAVPATRGRRATGVIAGTPRAAGSAAGRSASTPPDPAAELRAAGLVPTPPPAIYAGVLEVLALPDVGAAYLEGRGFDPAAAHADGFRAIAGAEAWRALWEYLADSYTPEERAAAGFPVDDHGRAVLPWRGKVPALALPYWYRGAVLALRFRALADVRQRYATLPGVTIPTPFNADALDAAAAAAGELHIVEGELNARALAAHGLHAVGLPGAGAWRPGWTPAVTQVGRLIAWYDDDDAGAKGRAKLAAALAAELGTPWLAARGRRCTLPADAGDVNDLHRAGQLGALVTAAPWRD